MPTTLEEILARRHSCRAFLDQPVGRDQMAHICEMARRAPSGANLQPGAFHVLTGAALESLKGDLAQTIAENRPIDDDYSYFPKPMPPHLKARQRGAGFALYDALGIDKRDLEGRKAQFARNYRFFDAPVGVIVTIEREMGKGCYMDLGMALATFFYAADGEGLGVTGIGALASYASVVRANLRLPEDQVVVCGIAVGHADRSAPVNQFRTERETLESYAEFRGFDD